MLAAAIARRLTPDDGAATTPGPQRPVDAWTTLGDFERLNVRPCRPYFVRSLATSIPDFNCICVPKISGAQHRPPDQLIRQVGTRPYARYLCRVVAPRLAFFYAEPALTLDEQDEVRIKPVQDDVSADNPRGRLNVEFEGVKAEPLFR